MTDHERAAVKVKSLAWGETSYGTPEVHTVVGIYRIVHAGNGGWSANTKSEVLRDSDGRTNFATLDKAKAACQTHYEHCILSALAPQAGDNGEEPVDVLSKAFEQCARIAYEYECSLSNYGDTETADVAKKYYEGGVGDASIGIAAAIRAALASHPSPSTTVVSQNAPDLEDKPCGITDPSTRDCANMKEVGGGMDGERYRCAVCGKGYYLDYEEMK